MFTSHILYVLAANKFLSCCIADLIYEPQKVTLKVFVTNVIVI